MEYTAVFSDIHGNDVAFEAILTDARRAAVAQYVCLGDAIQGGPQPAQVAARLRTLGCPVVMGNADAWLLSGQESGQEQMPPERRRKMDAIRSRSAAESNIPANGRAAARIRPQPVGLSRLAGLV